VLLVDGSMACPFPSGHFPLCTSAISVESN
jgi:hypothetical protein